MSEIIRVVEEEVKDSYLDYAMSVIIGRAIPDIRDGLKPVQRRIIYAMNEMGMTYDKPHKKCARVVGEVLGKFHPHGDTAVYDALVRMAQDFTYRYPLIDGHGNFGSLDGDNAAAMRYTEARLAKISNTLVSEMNFNIVPMQDNFDGSLKEPEVLPAKFPQLLANGASGIAVGMATSIPPHNLGELIDALLLILKNPQISEEELLKVLPGPDFPTGGIVVGKNGIKEYFLTGKGKVILRGRYKIETGLKSNKLVISEIPYSVNKAILVEKIDQLIKEKRLDGVSEIRDESGREGIRIVLELKKGASSEKVIKKLYKHTTMQITFGVIMLSLVAGVPKVLPVKDVLLHFLNFRKDIQRKRLERILEDLKKRLVLLSALSKALEKIDQVIEIIKKSLNPTEAKKKLCEFLQISEEGAQGILDLRLQRLTSLEREKILKDLEKTLSEIKETEFALNDEGRFLEILENELIEIKSNFADKRKTEISLDFEEEDILEEDIPEGEVIVTISKLGFIKRMKKDVFERQNKGGKGIDGIQKSSAIQDRIQTSIVLSNKDRILFISSKGRAYTLLAYSIPEFSRTSRGTGIANILPLSEDEKITFMVQIKEDEIKKDIILATSMGYLKKIKLENIISKRRNGVIAIKLNDSESVVGACMVCEDKFLLYSSNGFATLANLKNLRNMGNNSHGVIGMRLSKDDKLLGIVPDSNYFIVIDKNGNGKKVSSDNFTSHKRGTKGVRVSKNKLATILNYKEGMDLIIYTEKGKVIRIDIDSVKQLSRNAKGIKLQKLDKTDSVLDAAVVRSNANLIEDNL
ncbi:DNA gyrase subunit A [Thermodesulfobium acidiphilum]|uniref:DNA topoisomerase (ATP-hydrolyzing) n=1 Tax=Thermodesulfobium acidiphilum TaxID=1794699 RepID=A0A2R4VY62_THEAF|nr:DNA gyrase subunit A [Thermodesulfobium acidiphilum]AWB09396.1 DNA gyrase subunit A [Thermodesulfobium acidiphilum]